MANMGKQQVSKKQEPNLVRKKSIFDPCKFPQTMQNVTAPTATNDLSDYRQPQPGEMIANVQKSLQTTDIISPKFIADGNHLQASKREEQEANFASLNQIASPRISLPTGGVVQTKLTIGRPNDRYEQEADRVAASVVQQINRPTPVSIAQGDVVQGKKSKEEGRLRLKPIAQRQEAIAGGEASTDLASAINSARGSGQPLEAGLQRSMGMAMGADFSGVKVHTDSQADQLNRSIQAKAFTTGQDVFFRQGVYEPGSRGGQELIAHELTHVVQQNGGAVSRKPLPQPKLSQHPATEALSTSGMIQAKGDLVGQRQDPSVGQLPNQTGLPDKLKPGNVSYRLENQRNVIQATMVGNIDVTFTPGYAAWEQDGGEWHINWRLGDAVKGKQVFHVTKEGSPKNHYFFTLNAGTISDSGAPKGFAGQKNTKHKFSVLPASVQQYVIANVKNLITE